MKKILYFISRVYRRVTAPLRRLPDFIIIGTSKGGTSTLFNWLSQHPQLMLSKRKEVQFYGTQYSKGINWYKSFFPLKMISSKLLTGEATPYYLFYPLAPELVKRDNPKAKFIVLLRDPVARAYSHFQMQRRNGIEDVSTFNEAVNMEAGRLAGEEDKMMRNPNYSSQNHLRFAYMNRGKYGNQIARWLEHFPREQFLFLKSEEFFKDPELALSLVYDFLNIDRKYPENMPKKNVGIYNEINPESIHHLRAFFNEDNELLKQLIGNNFSYSN